MKKTTLCGLVAVLMTAIAPLSRAETEYDCTLSPPPRPCLDGDLDGYTPLEGDCDDSRAEAYPGAVEVCNGLDDNCDWDFADDTVACEDLEGGCGASIAPAPHHPSTWGGLFLIGALALWRRCRGR